MARNLSANRLYVPPKGLTFLRMRIFDTPGISTYTTDADAQELIVWVTGGGGGGGMGGPSYNHGGGGGGGATVMKRIVGPLASTYSITVGSGGGGQQTNAHSGGGGGTSSAFGSTTAEGGQGAPSHINGSADRGVNGSYWPSGSNYDVLFRGSRAIAGGGGDTDTDRPIGGAVGGASYWGSGGPNGTWAALSGGSGQVWGSGGGSGLQDPTTGANGTAGSGKSGVVIVEVYG